MAGCDGRQASCVGVVFACLSFVMTISSFLELVSCSHLEHFTSMSVLKHVALSEHLPVCVVFLPSSASKEGDTDQLESALYEACKKKKHKTQAISSWAFGVYSTESGELPIPLPRSIPALRCYFGQQIFHDFGGQFTSAEIDQWLLLIIEKHKRYLPLVEDDNVDASVEEGEITLIAYPTEGHYSMINTLLIKLRDEHRFISAYVVPPHVSQASHYRQIFNVSSSSQVLVLHQTETFHVSRIFKTGDLLQTKLTTFILALSMKIPHFTSSEFELRIMNMTIPHVWLVCFYASWAPSVDVYLSAFSRTVRDLQEVSTTVHLGLVNLEQEGRIVSQWISPLYSMKVPFVLLFMTDTDGNVVQHLFDDNRPTPWSVSAFLMKFATNEIQLWHSPWLQREKHLQSSVSDGPFGRQCPWSMGPFNESYISVDDRVSRNMSPEIITMEKLNRSDIMFKYDVFKEKLPTFHGIPMLSRNTWWRALETSRPPRRLLYHSVRRSADLSLVVYFIQDCSSCMKSMDEFQKIHSALKLLDGAAMYLVNCSSDASMCRAHNVTGYPTLVTYRGLSWMEAGGHCVQKDDHNSRIQLDYHGVLQSEAIVKWFSSYSGTAVDNLGFKDVGSITMISDGRLVAVLLPKSSRFLPLPPKRDPNYYYSYPCFPAICERLYGLVDCYSQYSREVPPSEFNVKITDMVIVKLVFHRRDGVQTNVFQMKQKLSSILEDEHSSLHAFHRPHRYNLRQNQRCEDDHKACTDFIVAFIRDHLRLPITHLTSTTFHARNSLLGDSDIPVLIALVHRDDITTDAGFKQMLGRAAVHLYSKVSVVTVDVNLYPTWAGQFVPLHYHANSTDDAFSRTLYVYPRFCLINWRDHHHAAFYPDVDAPRDAYYAFNIEGLLKFVNEYLQEPERVTIETEQF